MRQSSLLPIRGLARRCCCRRRGSHPAFLKANTSFMLVGRIPPRYARLSPNVCLRCFLRPNSESACSIVRNGRIVSCFCNGREECNAKRYARTTRDPCTCHRVAGRAYLCHLWVERGRTNYGRGCREMVRQKSNSSYRWPGGGLFSGRAKITARGAVYI